MDENVNANFYIRNMEENQEPPESFSRNIIYGFHDYDSRIPFVIIEPIEYERDRDDRSSSVVSNQEFPEIDDEQDSNQQTATSDIRTDDEPMSSPSIENNVIPQNVEMASPEKVKCTCSFQENSKKRKLPDDDDEEGNLCPICFDNWTNAGEHRVCCLKCGHLFGHSCVMRWLMNQKTCPTCKRGVRITDIRFIYAKKLIALDTSILNKVQLQLNHEQIEKNQLLVELVRSKQREELAKEEINKLKKQIVTLKSTPQESGLQIYGQPCASTSSSSPATGLRYVKEQTMEISRNGECRVMDFYKCSNTIAVSCPSMSPLFAGYGIRKVQIFDNRNQIFIPLHSKTIRDLSYRTEDELLLSASLDKYIKLTDTYNSRTVKSVHLNVPAWSCCWDTLNSVYFYVGEQAGCVHKYDMRNTNKKICSFKVPGDCSPVVSLSTVNWDESNRNGILVCKLNSCSVFLDTYTSSGTNETNSSEEEPSESNCYPLGLGGPFVSMRYCKQSKHLLLSRRPSGQSPFAKHSVCTMPLNHDGTVHFFDCNVVQTFQGSPVQKFLSRSCMMRMHGDMYVAAHNEMQRAVELFSIGSGDKKLMIRSSESVFDVHHVQIDANNYLCALNEKNIDIFKIEAL